MRAFYWNIVCLLAVLGAVAKVHESGLAAEPLNLAVRYQVETKAGSELYHRLERDETWQSEKTAIVVCDMWDSHHCYNAVLREREFAPRLNQLLKMARDRGVTIIHAPSDCMAAYEQHPARKRAIDTPSASGYPEDISKWCYQIPAEEKAKYPIDQSDGGEDDTPAEHAAWEMQLKEQGRNPQAPWKAQIDALEIDEQQDYISDSGKEIWSILEHRGIENVMLAGVHTNMCVLGRPFGLRRLATAGKNVVLIRDLTDTMYNPAAWPYVSHFSGTDLIVSHIERHVCPTISSDQLLGGKPFRFANDERAHLAVIINESEYETERTLPLYVREKLTSDYKISMVFGAEADANDFPGIELISEADALLLSVRRRTPPAAQLKVVRDFVASGKPVLGIRTANHSFSLRKGAVPAGAADWPELDTQVFGGSYTNHYGNQLLTTVRQNAGQAKHPILVGIDAQPFVAGGSLYIVSPVNDKATILLMGEVEGQSPEPVAWTFQRSDGGKSFYTSLGAPADFDHPVFQRLLFQAIQWAVE